jgi:plasmid stabilization system protein ParE
MFKAVLTRRAETSLEDITDYYLSQYSTTRTIKVLDSIDDMLERICKAPNHFPKCFDIPETGNNIRQAIVHDTFKIVFRIAGDTIEVIEIFHGSRDPELLKDI